MSTITLVLIDLPKGQGVAVQTDGGPPCIGQQRSPAEALAMDLLRICHKQANCLQYGQPSAQLAGELVQDQHEALLTGGIGPRIKAGEVIRLATEAASHYADIRDACPYPWGTSAAELFKQKFAEARALLSQQAMKERA